MKILNKLTIKHLKKNKKRTIVTIIGIILSTALMVGIGLLTSSLRDLMIQSVIEESGKHHVVIEVEKDKLQLISKNQNVLDYSYTSSLGFSEYNGIKNEYKPYIQVLGASLNYLENLELIQGRLPENENEILISQHLLYNGGLELKVNDKITLNLGKRISIDGFDLNDNPYTNEKYSEDDKWIINENIINTKTKEYTIVGICQRDNNESYSNPGYSAYTIDIGDKLDVFVTYKNIKNTFKYTKTIASNLGYKELSDNLFEEVNYNDPLLSINGITRYDNITTSLSLIICIVLSLISIACIIVIYNSFAISVMERKKQFGLFSSIGTTKKQLKYTVFYEAFIVGIIGIPLGILSAYLGIGIVIKIISNLLPIEYNSIRLVTYPLFIIIPVIFMIITILFSAYIPAKKASKVSPIEAIRQNDDIKIKSKKVKSPKLIRILFKIEGDIACKNIKRNKKKYRVTIISLFISIVLFISFSSIIKYGLEGTIDFVNIPDYEYQISIYSNNEEISSKFIKEIMNIKEIENIVAIENSYLYTNDLKVKLTKETIKQDLFSEDIPNVLIVNLNEEAYIKYKKEIGLKEDRPIVINKYDQIIYTNNSRKVTSFKLFDSVSDFNIYYENNKYLISNVYLTENKPFGLDNIPINTITIILNDELFEKIIQDENNIQIRSKELYITASEYETIDKLIEEYNNNEYVNIYSYNLKEELTMVKNLILVVKILLYGFISLVTLIGITSVLNTINTSIALRRKEFAVLRSVGLTPHGFNKILFFESLFFGLKSLFYGIPVGLIITLLLHIIINDIVEFNYIMFPIESIIICVIGVFIIIMLSQWYATRKIKHENILNAIREENI